MGSRLAWAYLLLCESPQLASDLCFYVVLPHMAGPLFFIFLFVVIVLVRVTTPRLRVEAMARLAWQPALWLLLLTFACYFVGWGLA